MLENGLVNSERKDSPIMPILKTPMKKVTEQYTRLLCTYVSSPNPEISLRNYYINRIKLASIMNFTLFEANFTSLHQILSSYIQFWAYSSESLNLEN